MASKKGQPSAGFVALSEKLMSAGRVRSSRLNLSVETPVSSQGGTAPLKKLGPNAIEEAQETSALYDGKVPDAPPLNPPLVRKKKTLGKGWFDMEPAVVDEQLKRDMKMVQMRNYIDPKRFYKNPDKPRAVLHVGTVVEGVGEFKSSRLTNKERKSTILGEILDNQVKKYTKRKYIEIQDSKPVRKRAGSKHKKAKKVSKLF